MPWTAEAFGCNCKFWLPSDPKTFTSITGEKCLPPKNPNALASGLCDNEFCEEMLAISHFIQEMLGKMLTKDPEFSIPISECKGVPPSKDDPDGCLLDCDLNAAVANFKTAKIAKLEKEKLKSQQGPCDPPGPGCWHWVNGAWTPVVIGGSEIKTCQQCFGQNGVGFSNGKGALAGCTNLAGEFKQVGPCLQ